MMFCGRTILDSMIASHQSKWPCSKWLTQGLKSSVQKLYGCLSWTGWSYEMSIYQITMNLSHFCRFLSPKRLLLELTLWVTWHMSYKNRNCLHYANTWAHPRDGCCPSFFFGILYLFLFCLFVYCAHCISIWLRLRFFSNFYF